MFAVGGTFIIVIGNIFTKYGDLIVVIGKIYSVFSDLINLTNDLYPIDGKNRLKNFDLGIINDNLSQANDDYWSTIGCGDIFIYPKSAICDDCR